MGSGAPARLLERGHERGAIAAAIERAAAGAGGAVLVEGVAGIGKTSLLALARELATEAGMTVLEARAAEFEAGYAWGIARQLFERVLRSSEDERAARLLSGAAALAATAVGLDAAGPVEDTFAAIHGLYWLAANLAQETPLLVAVDDVHWADAPSLRALSHLVRRLEGLPILVVLAVRAPRADAGDALLAALAADPETVVLRPATLGEEACDELVRHELAPQAAPGFQAACRELTGGNPFLLQALLASLAADGIRGAESDVEQVRRMTPAAVSRSVLLQLGRMPAAARAVARAVAVLGTAATTTRAGRLAELDDEDAAAAVAVLMAEHIVEGERELRYVHPLVRSAVYEDIALPVRERWHGRAARLLADAGAPLDEVTVHLLGAGPRGDAWLVGELRRAAGEAARRGAPDLATLYLERALAEPPPADAVTDVRLDLGRLEVAHDPAGAIANLAAAHAASPNEPRRSAASLALAHALAMTGRFGDAADVLESALAAGDDADVVSLRAALLNTARWDEGIRRRTAPLLAELRARGERGDDLAPELGAILAVELCAAAAEREAAVAYARAALRSAERLVAHGTPILPDTICVLLFAGHPREAEAAVDDWLRTSQRRGWRVGSSAGALVQAMIRVHAGAVSDAAGWAQQTLDGGAPWLAPVAAAFLVSALIERGALAEAHAALSGHSLDGELPDAWPFNVARHARGRLHAAAGHHEAAAEDLLAAGDRAERWGVRNPAMMDWRSAAAPSLLARDRAQDARRLCAEELALARGWGASRAVGVAMRASGLAEGGQRGAELLLEATRVLADAGAPLELARALVDLGAARRRAGARTEARDHLRAGLDLAHRQGSLALAERAREELVVAGGRPRRNALRGRDALTPGELRVAEMAAEGQTNREIAQALFVTQRTVEVHLTSTYGKLGISSRRELGVALAGD